MGQLAHGSRIGFRDPLQGSDHFFSQLFGAGSRFCSDTIELLPAGLRERGKLAGEYLKLLLLRCGKLTHRLGYCFGNTVESSNHLLS
jgi:hypothetical protein